MPLLGPAAMLLSFDVEPEAVAEHDDWHTREHMPERLSIPGFLRGTRWVAIRGEPRYMVLYEVEELGTLTSAAYLDRLDHPSPWTSRMMPHYRGMTRGFCRVTASAGRGMGGLAYVFRYEARTDRVASLQQWLATEIVPRLPARRGIASAHVLRAAATAPMTNEQRIRGADRAFDLALLVTGYDADALLAAAPALLAPAHLEPHDARAQAHGLYGSSHALTWLEATGDSPTTRTRDTGSA